MSRDPGRSFPDRGISRRGVPLERCRECLASNPIDAPVCWMCERTDWRPGPGRPILIGAKPANFDELSGEFGALHPENPIWRRAGHVTRIAIALLIGMTLLGLGQDSPGAALVLGVVVALAVAATAYANQMRKRETGKGMNLIEQLVLFIASGVLLLFLAAAVVIGAFLVICFSQGLRIQ